MRCTIIIAALVALSYAAPVDKPAVPVLSTTLTPVTELSSTLVPVLGSPSTPAPAPAVVSAEHPAPAPEINHPLPPTDHSVNLVHGLEPNRLENQPPIPDRPEPHLPLTISQPHHVQEHDLNQHPNKPSGAQKVPELEFNDEEISFLEAIGSLAVNYELALLQELEKEYDLGHSGSTHSHGHHSHGHKHHNSPTKDDDDEDCDCSAAVMIFPISEH